MARKTKASKKPPPFPQTPFHKLVYSWLTTFKRDGDLWNVLSALRSCDVAPEAKDSTTMRLRAILGLNSNILGNPRGKIPASNERPIAGNNRMDRNKILAQAPLHFQEHWTLAVKSVRHAMGYDLNTETKVPKGK